MAEFSGQREDETVEVFFRKHIIAMRKGFYGLLIPFALGSIPFLIDNTNLKLLWVAIGGLVLGSLLFFYHWIAWYYSIYIVTNQRIQQTTQTGIFGKTVIDLELKRIQNISYNVPGMTGELFNYGTLVLQTYVGDMVIEKTSHPEEVYNKLQDLLHLQENERLEPDEESQKQAV